MKVHGLFLVAIFSLSYMQMVKGQPQPQPNCQKTCGNVKIEYPFGISTGCYYPGDTSFNLTCENEELKFGTMKVVSILNNSQIRVMAPISYVCYDNQGILNRSQSYNYELGTFSLSNNTRFTGVGCDTGVLLNNYGGIQNQTIGCISVCSAAPPEEGSCSGEGCCQIPTPEKGNNFDVTPFSFGHQTSVHSFNPCSFAFIVENGQFNFSAAGDLENLRNVKEFPVLLDWSILDQTCNQRSLCGGNSTCINNAKNTTGYTCTCKEGFEGNPYLPGSCQDIDECTSTIHRHNCKDPSTCRNTPGSFRCECPSGSHLDITNMSCNRKEFGWTIILLVTTIGFLAILLVISFTTHRLRRRKDIKLRQQFFEKNGGGMLIQRLSGAGPSNVDINIFTEEGMKKATNGYDESRILGQGGQGTVYKGMLPDNSIVAIKKARLGDSSQVEQFINEVLVLSQVNHRNVVKLLGCCLETEVPLLVYEFINSGTLFDHLHGSMLGSSLTWEHRLRIAVEIAGTLAYLHSSASIPIIHRDVKSANILLDEKLTAKVADFGASRLIPMDKEQLTTMVQGTLGYLDPEYYNTGLLNEKSDVYSFGVVLMELISGQKALCFEKPQQSKHLVSYFASATKENRLHEIIDGQVMNENNQREIHEVARVAVECTRLIGEERPRMKEVATELEALRVTKTKHQCSDQYPGTEESGHLLGIEILSAQGETSTTGFDSIKNVAILDIEAGR